MQLISSYSEPLVAGYAKAQIDALIMCAEKLVSGSTNLKQGSAQWIADPGTADPALTFARLRAGGRSVAMATIRLASTKTYSHDDRHKKLTRFANDCHIGGKLDRPRQHPAGTVKV